MRFTFDDSEYRRVAGKAPRGGGDATLWLFECCGEHVYVLAHNYASAKAECARMIRARHGREYSGLVRVRLLP